MIPETEKCRQGLTLGSFNRLKKRWKDLTWWTRWKGKCSLSCDNMARNTWKDQTLKTGRQGWHNTEEERKTTLAWLTFPCVKTQGHLLQKVVSLTSAQGTQEKKVLGATAQSWKNQVTLLEKISRSHFIFAENIEWIAPHWSSLFSVPKTYRTCGHLSTYVKCANGRGWFAKCHHSAKWYPKSENGMHHHDPHNFLHQHHV